MIVPIIGAPGTGKTTVCRSLSKLYGIPHFEMSWMPEFRTMNGVSIDYSQDEIIAASALLAVAKTYVNAGHNAVFISDFRIEIIPWLLDQLSSQEHTCVKLLCRNPVILKERVLDPNRPSGYRNADEAIRANSIIDGYIIEKCISIDVERMDIDQVVKTIINKILQAKI